MWCKESRYDNDMATEGIVDVTDSGTGWSSWSVSFSVPLDQLHATGVEDTDDGCSWAFFSAYDAQHYTANSARIYQR
jgi:hypothetical protein